MKINRKFHRRQLEGNIFYIMGLWFFGLIVVIFLAIGVYFIYDMILWPNPNYGCRKSF